MIFSNYKDLINIFIKYDYVDEPPWIDKNIGNCDLSLRHKRVKC